MAVQLLGLVGIVLLVLGVREWSLVRQHDELCQRMREDRQVAELEAQLDLDWQWP